MANPRSVTDSVDTPRRDDAPQPLSDNSHTQSAPCLDTLQPQGERASTYTGSDQPTTTDTTTDVSARLKQETRDQERTITILENEVRSLKGSHKVKEVGLEVIQAEVTALSETVRKAYTELKSTMLQHGSAFSRLWINKPLPLRRKLLMEAFPRIPENDDSAFESFLRGLLANRELSLQGEDLNSLPKSSVWNTILQESDPRLIFRLQPTTLAKFKPDFLNQKLRDMTKLEYCNASYATKLPQIIYDKLDPKLLKKLNKRLQRQLDPTKEELCESFSEELLGLHLWPQLNLEDLEGTDTLSLLLHSRASNPPDLFIAADQRVSRFRWPALPMTTLTIDGCRLIFHYTEELRSDTPDHDDDPDREKFSRSPLLCFPPFHGLLALKLQAQLYPFLLRCCKLLLPQLPPPSLTLASLPETDSEGQYVPSKPASMEEGLRQAAFGLPDAFQIDYLERVVDAGRSAAEDHVWALRDDPGYFATTLQNIFDHSAAFRCKPGGEPSHDMKDPSMRQVLWNSSIRVMLHTSIVAFEGWSSILGYVRRVKDLLERQGPRSHTGGKSSHELTFAFVSLHMLLAWLAGDVTCRQATSFFKTSPQSNECFRYFTTESEITELMTLRNQPRHDILRVLQTLCNMHHQNPSNTRSLLPFMTWIQQQVAGETSSRLFSGPTVQHIGDTFVLYHCLDMLDIYRPNSDMSVEASEIMGKRLTELYNSMFSMQERYFLKIGDDIDKLGSPDGERFQYPIGKRIADVTVARLRDSEANLDEFWAAVDACLSSEGVITERLRALLSTRTIHRTPERKSPISSNTTSSPKPEAHFLSSYYQDLQQRTEATLSQELQPTPRNKGKTKGTAQPVEQPPDIRELDEDRVEQPPTRYPINKKHEKVFQTLFFTPGQARPTSQMAGF
jgi:hypothetical protein